MPERACGHCGINMAYKLIKTDSYQRDLDAVIAYIALSLENKIAAASLLDTIEASYDHLQQTPLMYVSCKHRLTRAHREKQLKMSCQALHNAPPNRT